MVPSTDNVTEGTMPDDTQMTITERRTYLGRMHERYRRADRLGRGGDRKLIEQRISKSALDLSAAMGNHAQLRRDR